MIILGIDNGPTGSIGVIEFSDYQKQVEFHHVPTMEYLNYQKSKAKFIKRLDHRLFKVFLEGMKNRSKDIHLVMERPFTGKFLNAVVTGIRFFEAMIICLEELSVGYEVIDSKEWQQIMLPNCKPKQTKKVSLEVAKKLYPNIQLAGFDDADGLLIAEWKLRQLMRLT